MKRTIILTIIIASLHVIANAQTVGLKTNLLSDILTMPTLELEVSVGKKTTLGMTVLTTNHPYGTKLEMTAFQPEIRWYCSGRLMHGLFVGACGIYTQYDSNMSDHTCDGSALGAGVTFGYALSLSKHWNLDMHAGVAYYHYENKEYYEKNGDYNSLTGANARGDRILPTIPGVSLVYVF